MRLVTTHLMMELLLLLLLLLLLWLLRRRGVIGQGAGDHRLLLRHCALGEAGVLRLRRGRRWGQRPREGVRGSGGASAAVPGASSAPRAGASSSGRAARSPGARSPHQRRTLARGVLRASRVAQTVNRRPVHRTVHRVHEDLAVRADVGRGRHSLLLLPAIAEPDPHHLLLELQLICECRDLLG